VARRRFRGGPPTRFSGIISLMAFVALISAVLATAVSSGVSGKALIDPARPVCTIDQPCSAPDPNEILAFWHGSRRAGTATTKADGTFRIALPPGFYRVTLPRRAGYMARLNPVQVRVLRGTFARVTFRVDAGIR
jgi:hypothetical protein